MDITLTYKSVQGVDTGVVYCPYIPLQMKGVTDILGGFPEPEIEQCNRTGWWKMTYRNIADKEEMHAIMAQAGEIAAGALYFEDEMGNIFYGHMFRTVIVVFFEHHEDVPLMILATR